MITHSLVIPCFNEYENIKILLKKLQSKIKSNNFELILVDNGSTDKTSIKRDELIEEYPFARFIYIDNNIGYGNGILKGLNEAKGEVIGWTHADLQTDPVDALLAFKIFEKNENNENLFIKGNRKGRKFIDNFFTFGMSIFESLLLGNILWDINAQPTIFHKKFFKSFKNPPLDFSLDLYSFYLAKSSGMKILRIPVLFPKRKFGISSWDINFSSKLKFIKRTITYSLNLKKSFE